MLSSDSSNLLLIVVLVGGAVAVVKALQRRSRRHGSAGWQLDFWRRTPSGKLRATTHDGGAKGSGPDYGVYMVADLSDRAKKVYLCLTAIVDAEGYCFPFYRTIAKRTGLSTSTVSKAIGDLENAGLLTRQQRVSRRGGSSDLYHLKRVSVR
jgi:DNA-binding transcriptional ArsR family regulator